MKAIQINEYGSTDVLKISEVNTPQIQSGQILVQTKAFGINPVDWKIRNGSLKDFIPITFPHILGFELSGIVAEVADDVHQFKIGDRIYSHAAQTYAEYVTVQADEAQIIPDFLNFEEAASLPSNTQVAYSALKVIGSLEAGQNVLILAGSGGVGVAAIQIAKALGANVATTVSTKNIELVKQLGADEIIDYTTTSLTHSQTRFDLIIDLVGGQTQIDAWTLLTTNGTLVSLTTDERARIANILDTQRFLYMNGPQNNPVVAVHELILSRKVKPVLDQVFQFDEICQAHQKSETGHVAGKIVVSI